MSGRVCRTLTPCFDGVADGDPEPQCTRKPRDAVRPGSTTSIVGATGARRRTFVDDIDRLDWLRRLRANARSLSSGRASLFCQMTTHVHAIVDDLRRVALERACTTLNSATARGSTRRHDRRGTLIRRRYWSTRIEDDAQLLGRVPLRRAQPGTRRHLRTRRGLALEQLRHVVRAREDVPVRRRVAVLSMLGTPPRDAGDRRCYALVPMRTQTRQRDWHGTCASR